MRMDFLRMRDGIEFRAPRKALDRNDDSYTHDYRNFLVAGTVLSL